MSASSSEFELFKKLANPRKTDFASPKMNAKTARQTGTEGGGNASVFQQAVNLNLKHGGLSTAYPLEPSKQGVATGRPLQNGTEKLPAYDSSTPGRVNAAPSRVEGRGSFGRGVAAAGGEFGAAVSRGAVVGNVVASMTGNNAKSKFIFEDATDDGFRHAASGEMTGKGRGHGHQNVFDYDGSGGQCDDPEKQLEPEEHGSTCKVDDACADGRDEKRRSSKHVESPSEILRHQRRRNEDSHDDGECHDGSRDKEGSVVRFRGLEDGDDSRNKDDAKKSVVDANLTKEINSEKQGYLLELMKFKKQDVEMTRKYTMEDSLEDIQFEFDRIRTHLETVNNVNMIRDGLMFAFQGIEFANKQFGPVLQLNGWSKAAKKDKQKYNHVIERLYKKHWRHGNMSPETEFGWLIGSSMLKHHFKCKLLGGGSSKGGGDNDSDSDDETGGSKKNSQGGGSKGGFDLSSLMSGMLPKFAGFGGGNASSAPKPSSNGASAGAGGMAKPTNGRPVMRGPNASPVDVTLLPTARPFTGVQSTAMPMPMPEFSEPPPQFRHQPPLGHGNYFNPGNAQQHQHQQQRSVSQSSNPGYGHGEQQSGQSQSQSHFSGGGYSSHQPQRVPSQFNVLAAAQQQQQHQLSMQLEGVQRQMNEKLLQMKQENERLTLQLSNAEREAVSGRDNFGGGRSSNGSSGNMGFAVSPRDDTSDSEKNSKGKKNSKSARVQLPSVDADDSEEDDTKRDYRRHKGSDDSDVDDDTDESESETGGEPEGTQRATDTRRDGTGSNSTEDKKTSGVPPSGRDEGKQISIVGVLNSHSKSKRGTTTAAKKNVVSLQL
jgi:hypothetical protein